MKLIKAKVYMNKKNGQGRVHIPKKAFELCPDEVWIAVPSKLLKKGWWKK